MSDNRTTPCKKCGGTEFYSDGTCKQCKKTRMHQWHIANRDVQNAKSVAKRLKNPDYHKIFSFNWRKLNPEKAKAQGEKWRAENPEINKARHKKYQKENVKAMRIKCHNYRAKKRANGGKLSKGIAEKLYKLQHGLCACGCGQLLGNKYELDHRMPIALGGSNTDDNMQLLTKTCNRQKHAKHPIDFMQSRGFLL